MLANELRGEVDIELEGVTYVLRPSYDAVVTIEQSLGMGLVEIAQEADDGKLRLGEAAIVVTELVKAWGAELTTDSPPEHRAVRSFNPDRVGRLIHTYGLMAVLPRIAIVLSRAASGGVDAEGKVKAPRTTMETTSIPGAEQQASPPPPSAGRQKRSGGARPTSSGPRSKRGKT